MWRKILGWVILAIMFAGSICGIVFGLKYEDAKNNNYQEVYEDLKEEHTALEDKYDVLVAKHSNINNELYHLNLENEANKALVAELEEDKAELEAQAEVDEDTILSLQSQINSLNATIADNEQTIATLEAEKLALQNEITRINTLLENYVVHFTPTEEEEQTYVTTVGLGKSPTGGVGKEFLFAEFNPSSRVLRVASTIVTSSREYGIRVVTVTLTADQDDPMTFFDIITLIQNATIYSAGEYFSMDDSDIFESTDVNFGVYHNVLVNDTITTINSYGVGIVKDDEANIIDIFEVSSRTITLTDATDEDISTAKTTLTDELYQYVTNRVTLYD